MNPRWTVSVKRMCKVITLVALLATSGPSAALEISTGTALINLIQTASSFFAPEPTGPDPTLEAVLQNRESIEQLHQRMGTLEQGLLNAIEGLDEIHMKLKDEMKRSLEQQQRDRVRGAMESIQIYVAGMERDLDGLLIVTTADVERLTQRWDTLSVESRTLAQGHDINAPVLAGALAIELGLLQALGRDGQIEATKNAYRRRLVSLFDPERSRRNPVRGPSLREELVRIGDEHTERIIEDIEFDQWNRSGNFEAELQYFLILYEEGQAGCSRVHRWAIQEKQSIMSQPLFPMPHPSAQRLSFNFSSQAGDTPREPPKNLCQVHHHLLAYTKRVVERLRPTQEERRWMTPDWPCAPEHREQQIARSLRLAEDSFREALETSYRNWRDGINARGCGL